MLSQEKVKALSKQDHLVSKQNKIIQELNSQQTTDQVDSLKSELNQHDLQSYYNIVFSEKKNEFNTILDKFKQQNLEKQQTLERITQQYQTILSDYSKLGIEGLSNPQSSINNNNNFRTTGNLVFYSDNMEQKFQEQVKQYDSYMEEIKVKRLYTQTLNHMLKRNQKTNEGLKSKLNEIRELHNVIDNTNSKLVKTYTDIRKQKIVIYTKKDQETQQIDQKVQFLNQFIEAKSQKQHVEDQELQDQILSYQNYVNQVKQKEQIIQSQLQKISQQDQLLEAKYQQKLLSESLLDILEMLEIILAVFKSDNPREFLDANFNLDYNKAKNYVNSLTQSQLLNKQSCAQSKMSLDSEANFPEEQSFQLLESQIFQSPQVPKRFSKQFIINKLDKFFLQYNNNIDTFVNEIIKIYNIMYSKNITDRDKAFSLEKEKKDMHNTLKNLNMELQQYVQDESEVQKMIAQQIGEYNSKLVSEDSSMSTQLTMNELLIELNDHDVKKQYQILLDYSKTFEQLLQQMLIYAEKYSKIFTKIKELSKIDESKYQQLTDELMNQVHIIREKIFAEEKLVVFDGKKMSLMEAYKSLFSDHCPNNSFYVNMMFQSDFMTRYFVNKQYIIDELTHYKKQNENLSSSEIVLYMFNLIYKNLNQTSKECAEICQTIFIKFAEFIQLFKSEIDQIKKTSQLKPVDMFIYDQTKYYQNKGQLIGHQIFGRYQQQYGFVHDNETDTLQTIDLQYKIPSDQRTRNNILKVIQKQFRQQTKDEQNKGEQFPNLQEEIFRFEAKRNDQRQALEEQHNFGQKSRSLEPIRNAPAETEDQEENNNDDQKEGAAYEEMPKTQQSQNELYTHHLKPIKLHSRNLEEWNRLTHFDKKFRQEIQKKDNVIKSVKTYKQTGNLKSLFQKKGQSKSPQNLSPRLDQRSVYKISKNDKLQNFGNRMFSPSKIRIIKDMQLFERYNTKEDYDITQAVN